MDITQECRISEILDWNFALGVPKDKTKRGRQNALRQIKEECKELPEAIKNNDDVEQLDALVDILWVVVGYAYRMGWDIEGAMDEVYLSNHTKMLIGGQLDPENAETEIKRLEERGKEGVRVVEADYGDLADSEGFVRTGSLQDKYNKVQKPSRFVSPDLWRFV